MSPTNSFADGCAWVEGEYVPISEARVPILDSGFFRSDATYDVAAVWDGRFFRLDDHLNRLFDGCAKIKIAPPSTKEQIRDLMIEVVRRSGLRNAYVEAVVTRGISRAGGRDPRSWSPNLYVYAIPYVWIVSSELQTSEGVSLAVARNTRRIPVGSVDPTVKNFHWGDLVRGLYEAYDRDAQLAVLPDADGFVTEGAGFNVFAAIGGELYTPARGVLRGITRGTALEIAAEFDIPTHVTDIPVGDLDRAEEIFLTSTAGGVMPVGTIDGRQLSSCRPGAITYRVRERYWELHRDPRFSFAVDYANTAGKS